MNNIRPKPSYLPDQIHRRFPGCQTMPVKKAGLESMRQYTPVRSNTNQIGFTGPRDIFRRRYDSSIPVSIAASPTPSAIRPVEPVFPSTQI